MLKLVEDEVRRIIGETADCFGKPDMEDILQDIGFDPSQVDVLIMYLEETFPITIPDDSILPSTKVGTVCDKVEELIPY